MSSTQTVKNQYLIALPYRALIKIIQCIESCNSTLTDGSVVLRAGDMSRMLDDQYLSYNPCPENISKYLKERGFFDDSIKLAIIELTNSRNKNDSLALAIELVKECSGFDDVIHIPNEDVHTNRLIVVESR